jgi:hypothetical protein
MLNSASNIGLTTIINVLKGITLCAFYFDMNLTPTKYFDFSNYNNCNNKTTHSRG